MWPATLEMTRDECRRVLRVSELDTYSSIMSTFRAQGGISEGKAKILKELRDLFHISDERHKAEARRVSNDEKLSTIAEMISGPNTGHDWSKEGHRAFPLMPRSEPHTALLHIANHAVSVAAAQNQLLPMPCETGRNLDADMLAVSTKPIVMDDPLLAPVNNKHQLKRPHALSENMSASKKRIPDAVAAMQMNHTNMRIQQLYHTHSNNPPFVAPATTVTGPQSRKGQSKRSQQRNATNKQTPARQPKQKNAAKQSSAKAAKTPAYGSSAKSTTRTSTAAHDTVLLAETYPDKSFKWSHGETAPPKGSNTMNALPAPPQPPDSSHQQPFQIVYTTTSQVIEPGNYANSTMMDNNSSKNISRINEFTPVSWDMKPAPNPKPPGRPVKMMLQTQSSTTVMTTAVAQSHHTPVTTPPPPPLPTTNSRKRMNTSKANSNDTGIAQQTIKPTRPKLTIPNASTISATNAITVAAQTSALSTGFKPKIQITSQQIIHPPFKLQPQLQPQQHINHLNTPQPQVPLIQMKAFQSKGNVKLIQSSDGRMIIKGPVENNGATAVSGIKNISTISANTKLAIQKVTLLPSVKQTAGKNMVVMQKCPDATTTIVMDVPTMTPEPPLPVTPELSNTTQIMRHLESVTTVKPISISQNNINTSAITATTNTTNTTTATTATTTTTTTTTINRMKQQKQRVIRRVASPLKATAATSNLHSALAKRIKPNTLNRVVAATTDWEEELDRKACAVQVANANVSRNENVHVEYVEEAVVMVVDGDHYPAMQIVDGQSPEQMDTFICEQDDDIIQYDEGGDVDDEYGSNAAQPSAAITVHADRQLSVDRKQPADPTSPESFVSSSNDYDDGTVVEKQTQSNRCRASVSTMTITPTTATTSTSGSDEPMMLQMQEYDQSGSSQMRNVTVEELVASGHIILDAIESHE